MRRVGGCRALALDLGVVMRVCILRIQMTLNDTGLSCEGPPRRGFSSMGTEQLCEHISLVIVSVTVFFSSFLYDTAHDAYNVQSRC